ncbi:MAG: hypothetical protein QOJ29_3881 [Thermoleophilaceae bacterium]|nr:hypothetical protein [Thermoleophilaceae bacterium]
MSTVVKRYKASTEWHVPPPWDWWLLENIERFLLERLASDNGTQRELTTRDSHGDVAAATIAEARERIEHEATDLQELSLIVWTGPEQASEGKSEMAATLRVRRSARGCARRSGHDLRLRRMARH